VSSSVCSVCELCLVGVFHSCLSVQRHGCPLKFLPDIPAVLAVLKNQSLSVCLSMQSVQVPTWILTRYFSAPLKRELNS
jgi:hypothetical protein